MNLRIARITLLVRDQEEALRFYTDKLGMQKRMDMSLPDGYRWLTVAPAGSQDVEFVFQKAADGNEAHVGKQAGSSVYCVLHTDDINQTYKDWSGRGVEFTQTPEDRPYGIEALFKDLYGNLYDLLQPKPMS